jgi:hypothetical protein
MTELVKNKYAVKLSVIALLVITIHSLTFNNFWKSWKGNETQFVWDVNNYYSYLPGTFLHQDLTFSYPNNYWLIEAPNGGKVEKGTCGMAIMYMPFFLIGHKIAINTHVPLDGYSGPYSEMVHYGTFFYSLIGFIFLRRSLLKYFSEGVVATTLLCIFFGTNLFYYTVAEGEMSHSYLFCLSSVILWHIIRWHETFKWRYAVYIGLLTGLMTLIRPTEILIVLVIVLYGVSTFAGFKEKLRLLLGKWKHLLIMVLCGFLALLPQMIYWKWITDRYLFFSYGDREGFFWGDPQIINVLFSYRKGWLVYTPLMIFTLIGLFFGRKLFPKLDFAFKVYFLITLYVISCWWTWWFGGGFGMRALIQTYSMLAFFLAAFIHRLFLVDWKEKFRLPQLGLKYIVTACFLGLISLNLIQTYQYNKRMIHFDSMTRKSYWFVFGKFEFEGNEGGRYQSMLRPIDYFKALDGERNQ